MKHIRRTGTDKTQCGRPVRDWKTVILQPGLMTDVKGEVCSQCVKGYSRAKAA